MSALTDSIKMRLGKTAVFEEFHNGTLFYTIEGWRLPVPVEELDGAVVLAEENSATFLKWITRQCRLELNSKSR